MRLDVERHGAPREQAEGRQDKCGQQWRHGLIVLPHDLRSATIRKGSELKRDRKQAAFATMRSIRDEAHAYLP
jgi:hypothetical protein